MREAPSIDKRSGEEIFQALVEDLKNSPLIVAADGDLQVGALLRIFSRYCEMIIQRLNQVPEKNHIAFLDMLNVSRIPPVSARVPLTFKPVKKLPPRRTPMVPAYTKVAAPPDSGETEATIFETTRDLALTNIELKKVLAVDPGTDLWADKSFLATTDEAVPEFPFAVKNPVPHEVFFGNEQIFGRKGISELRLHFTLKSPSSAVPRPLSLQWFIPTPKEEILLIPASDTSRHLSQSGEVVFRNLPQWVPSIIAGEETCRLGCRLLERLPCSGPPLKLPTIDRMTLTASWEGSETEVDSAFFNGIPLDLSKDFFPLGERPRFGDVLYLSSSLFAVVGADIGLKIKLTNPASANDATPIPRVNPDYQPVIRWEYWDGRRWSPLPCSDGTKSLIEDGVVSFAVPSVWPPTPVNGIEAVYLRARLISGGYGNPEGYERHSPPSIESVMVQTSCSGTPEVIITNNNLELSRFDGKSGFHPFTAASDASPTLYFGFEIPKDEFFGGPKTGDDRFGGVPLDLYVHSVKPEGKTFLRHGTVCRKPNLNWQYWNGEIWTDAKVEDATELLTASGIIRFQIVRDTAPWREYASASGETPLCWFRVKWTSGEYECPPRLARLLLNTVSATQTFSLQKEILGSSNGLPDQLFYTARKPILRDLKLEVREPDIPPPAELRMLLQEEGDDAIPPERQGTGKLEPVWIRWHEVGDFLSSGNNNRHFVVDRETGEIRFGNGIKGMIPPAGANNVRLREYQTGGGRLGNKPQGSIAQLRTSVPYVVSVSNLVAAEGGQDIEPWASVKGRGAGDLRHRGRAVTLEDYEDLSKAASPIVAKTKCYPNFDLAADPEGKKRCPGVLSLFIVPWSERPEPAPDMILLRQVRDFLNERRSPDAELILLAPEYLRISVTAVVVAANSLAGAEILQPCQEALDRYLHPITGGADGRGWDFGQLPHDSDFYALLESIRGLDHVFSLSVRVEEAHSGLRTGGRYLICSGEHQVSLRT